MRPSAQKIQHVVIIVQENRSVDNLFQSLPGANTQSYGLDSNNRKIQLQPQPLNITYDPSHLHQYWLLDYDNGKMNGFDKEICEKGKCPVDGSYTYVPESDVKPYYEIARQYTFADEMFQTDQGPSFPAHQYLVSGTSTIADGSPDKAAGNPWAPGVHATGGCDSPPGSLDNVINLRGEQPKSLRGYPCYKRLSLMNELDTAGISWKHYQNTQGAGLWKGVDAIYSIWSNPAEMKANVVTPPSQILTDITNGNLADVVWVTPTALASDHPGITDGTGPSWVASVVNAIGQSKYWRNTAIFVVWDDWGGFYDHVPPQIYNSFELGFRVPLIVVSPYAKAHYVSHVTYEFGSILKFAEKTFGLPSMETTDERANELSDCFDFAQKPRPFKVIPSKYDARYFLTASTTGDVDDQ